MTCEVALLNRRAVALAADSATTVSYWEQGEQKQRYFKGTNKLFNLSSVHPIAIMTSDSGNLQGVPWEVVVKAYRDSIGPKPHDYVSGYAHDLFEYIQSNAHLYPSEFQEKQLLEDVTDVAARLVALVALTSDVRTAVAAGDDKAAVAAAKTAFDGLSKRIAAAAFIGHATASTAKEISAKYKQKIGKQIREREFIAKRASLVPLDALIRLAPTALLKRDFSTLETTGLAISGFGDKEYFPYLRQYTTYGMVLGKLLFEEGDETKIDQENTAQIVPIARSSMIKTFMYGAPPSMLTDIETEASHMIETIQANLISAGMLDPNANIDQIKADGMEHFNDSLVDRLLDSHSRPLRRVIGLLPVNELAELAEILVSIESLKERVTSTTETVGGPIDVAVISKSDGFIWVKRKHYFEPKLNPRYFAKIGANHHVK
ncbi:hypothetical protein ACQR06_17730 [Bradyrhizobium sp. HKCCYLRH1065]|uniref:hypothetical protein n=1 Tax=Bradyrhizobium sp. HKCCYLRH1065 TaxID=3420753 RepID=UPI003EC0B495